MKINELQANQGRVELTAKVVDKGKIREFDKFGKKGKVCDATLEDDTGRVKLTLWNEQTDEVNLGDTVKVSNGWVGEYQGEKQLTSGKFGKLEVVEKAPAVPATEPRTEQTTQKKAEQKQELPSKSGCVDTKDYSGDSDDDGSFYDKEDVEEEYIE